ncbi:cation:proton antiporter (plasmid) [Acaryochloris sp. CCMEE 5410]|nr:cation:proton antiporter [Acaryochloris sp. CCMEE 5410]
MFDSSTIPLITFWADISSSLLQSIPLPWGVSPLLENKLPLLLASASGAEGETYAKGVALAATLTLIIVYVSAQLFGELAIRIGLPAVLGELIAGLVIGISGLHVLMLNEGTQVADWMVAAVSWIAGSSTASTRQIFDGPVQILFDDYAQNGVGILLFKIGLEADLKELIRVGSQATSVAISGVILPFALGFWGLSAIFHLETIPAMFGAAALTATSIGITSRIMQDMGVLNTREGQIILGAAVLDDILGIAILAVAVGIADHGTIDIAGVLGTVVSAVLFVATAITLNRSFGPVYINFLSRFGNPYSILIGAITFLVFMAAVAEAIGLESILGCFVAGIVLGNTSATKELEKACDPLVALFATIFFVTIGAKTDLTVLNLSNPSSQVGLSIALFLILVAIATKMAAGYVVFTPYKVNRLAIGTGMVPRGEVGLVFAGLGASTGALSASVNVAIVLMVMGTTFVAPPMLRWAFAREVTVSS